MPLRHWTAIRIFAATVSVATAGSAEAQTGLPVESGARPDLGLKSETTALMWSLLGTVVPFGTVLLTVPHDSEAMAPALILVGSLVVGPSLGHFYAGRPVRALAGIGIRTVALFGVAAGFGAAWNNNSGGSELMLAGMALGGTILVWDIVAAPRSARVHNAKVRSREVAIALTPSFQAPGVRLSARISF